MFSCPLNLNISVGVIVGVVFTRSQMGSTKSKNSSYPEAARNKVLLVILSAYGVPLSCGIMGDSRRFGVVDKVSQSFLVF